MMSDESPSCPSVIQFEDFAKLDVRVARIVEAVEHPNADKLFVLKVDMGGEQRQLCAGLREHYTAEQLLGMRIIVVANLAPRRMRGEVSQGMLLAATCAQTTGVVLLTTAADVAPGSKVS